MRKYIVLILTLVLLLPIGVYAESETKISDAHNTNLATLEVKGFNIDFNKYKKLYSIEVKENVNKLEVTAIPEVESTTVTITGADDLEKNHNKVTIELKASGEDTKTYVINVIKRKELKADTAVIKIDNKYIDYAKYIGLGALGLGIVIFAVLKIRDKKVEKGLDDL